MNIATVTIPKKEYQELVEKKIKYERLQEVWEEDIFGLPRIRSRKAILSALKATKRYNKKFLESIKKGLKRSHYFQA